MTCRALQAMTQSRAPATRNAVALLIKDESLGLMKDVTSICKRHLNKAHTTVRAAVLLAGSYVFSRLHVTIYFPLA